MRASVFHERGKDASQMIKSSLRLRGEKGVTEPFGEVAVMLCPQNLIAEISVEGAALKGFDLL